MVAYGLGLLPLRCFIQGRWLLLATLVVRERLKIQNVLLQHLSVLAVTHVRTNRITIQGGHNYVRRQDMVIAQMMGKNCAMLFQPAWEMVTTGDWHVPQMDAKVSRSDGVKRVMLLIQPIILRIRFHVSDLWKLSRRMVMRYVNVPVCLAVSVVVACTSSTTFAKRHRLDQAETKQVLTMLRDRMRTNFEQIGTWQGTWLYEETTVLQSKDYAAYKITSSAETVRQTSKGKIDFVYDRLQNQLFAHASGDDPVFTEGKDGPQLKVASLKSADKFMIFSADQYWHSEVVAYDKEDRQLERMGALEPLQNANRDAGIGNFVQPIQLMSYGGGRPYWESISFLIEHPEIWGQDDQVPKSGLSFWVYEVTENSPTTYSLVVVGPKGPNNSLVIKQEILIHEPAGYNVMCVREFKDDVIVGTQSVSYGKQQGIFIPANVTRTYYTPDKKEQMVRELKLRDSKINESIPADQFEISQLGLKDGEQVEDKIKDCKLVYAGGKLQSQPAP